MADENIDSFSWSQAEVDDSCAGDLHPLALRGLESFNRGEYFEAHELLELAWREEAGPVRDLYRGILQVGVGYYHIERGNYRGARKMFIRCRQWLDPFPARCRGVNVEHLRQDYRKVEAEVARLGADQIHLLDKRLFKPVIYTLTSMEGPHDG